MMSKLVILDLDETLIHTVTSPLARVPDFCVGLYKVYIRPFLNHFLNTCFFHFSVGVWTSSTNEYAMEVVQAVFLSRKPAFMWDRSRCTLRYDHEIQDYYWVKVLKKLKRRGYRLEGMLIVDDSWRSAERNYGNLIPVAAWHGDPEDKELLLLSDYLQGLINHEDVRTINKKNGNANQTPLDPIMVMAVSVRQGINH